MTRFASLLCFSVLFLTTGGQTGIGGTFCLRLRRSRFKTAAYLFWLDVTNVPAAAARSAASDARFNVQSLKRFGGETAAFLRFFNSPFFIC